MAPSILFSNNVVSNDIFKDAAETKKTERSHRPSLSDVIASRFEESSFFQQYELDTQEKALGDGSFSVCRRCRHRKTQNEFAVKIVSRKMYCDREASLLRACQGHSNVVKLIEVHQDRAHVYLVMELLTGGELLQRSFTEEQANRIMQQLVSAMQFIHSRGVVHRDLKPENIIFAHQGEDSPIKIVDFGFAQVKHSCEPLHTPCFTLPYAAPEVIAQKGYDQSCDLWSLGAILYSMLSGRPPLRSDTLDEIRFDANAWNHLSKSVRQVMEGLLTTDPSKRLTVTALVNHPWMAEPSATTRVLVASSQSLETAVISTPCERITEGFRLREVDGAKLAQRRKLHKRSTSSSVSSSASTTSSSPSVQLLRPPSASTSNATITSASPAQPCVFDFGDDKVNEYLSSLSSSSDSNSPRVSLQQGVTARKRRKRGADVDLCQQEGSTRSIGSRRVRDVNSEFVENKGGPLTRLRKRQLEQDLVIGSSDSSTESYESTAQGDIQREANVHRKQKAVKRFRRLSTDVE